MKTKGVTLIEILIAIAIFAVISIISGTVMVDVFQAEKKNSINSVLYEDARIIFQQIANEVHAGTIDYDEYYSVKVLQNAATPVYYGINYGAYGSRFFDPGEVSGGGATINPADLGTDCTFPEDLADPADCEVIYIPSVDLNVGQNPFVGDGDDANAFCDHGIGFCDSNEMEELYIIDSSGTKKTILARKKVNDLGGEGDHALAIMRMEGMDLDQNGFIDIFTCTDDFTCEDDAGTLEGVFVNYGDFLAEDVIKANNIRLPDSGDLNDPLWGYITTSYFVPISPLRSTIKDLRFIINPVEDPYKAFAENDMRTQPSVTVIMKIGLAENYKNDYPGEFYDVTVQSTFAAGVVGRIDSYPPTNDVEWINNVMDGNFDVASQP